MTAFRFLTAGESHGPALGVTLEGVPAGLAVSEDAIAADLVRRQKGYGRGARQSIRWLQPSEGETGRRDLAIIMIHSM